MKKGTIQGLLFYGIGFGSAVLYCLLDGDVYAHSPSPHHMMIANTIFIGFIWLIIDTILWLVKGKTKRREAVMMVHGFALISSTITISYILIY